KDFANAKQSELEKHIHSTGFYRNKAKNIINCCKMLVAHYWGKVPLSMQELVCLPGVGRKTANIVLSNSGIIEGIAVDTHVARVSRLLGWTKSKNPLIIERDLMRLFSKSDWHLINALLVWHGRRVCVARKPKCGMCLLKNLCPSAGR
ncbi:endonuclease III, partial [Candidatus Micrarchaeota archaeon CG11_big_fil_rev_8_21_14_0_20_47_5]